MANRGLQQLEASLQRIRIRGEIIEGSRDDLVGHQVEITIAATDLGRIGVEATPLSQVTELGEAVGSIGAVAARPQPVPFILTPEAASYLGVQPFGRPGSKVLGPRSIDYWGTGGGFNAVKSLKSERRDFISPRPRTRGFVRFEDCPIVADAIVVENRGTRSTARWVWKTEIPSLPRFSLIFTEFVNGDYSFCSIWHKELEGWLERATTIVDLRTERIIDFEVAATRYYPSQPGRGSLWHLYSV